MTEVKTCRNCGMSLTEGQREWCSSFCITEYGERTRNKFCLNCGKSLTGKQKIYCSRKCGKPYRYKNDPIYRERLLKQSRERYKDPEIQEQLKKRLRERRQDPEYRERENKRSRERLKDPEYRECRNKRARERRQDPEVRKYQNRCQRGYTQKMRKEVLEFYGSICNWSDCDNDNPIHLDIDHVNDDGSEHRKAMKKIGRCYNPKNWVYRHIIKGEPSPLSEDYGDRWTKREDFQILCRNHNYEKEYIRRHK